MISEELTRGAMGIFLDIKMKNDDRSVSSNLKHRNKVNVKKKKDPNILASLVQQAIVNPLLQLAKNV